MEHCRLCFIRGLISLTFAVAKKSEGHLDRKYFVSNGFTLFCCPNSLSAALFFPCSSPLSLSLSLCLSFPDLDVRVYGQHFF